MGDIEERLATTELFMQRPEAAGAFQSCLHRAPDCERLLQRRPMCWRRWWTGWQRQRTLTRQHSRGSRGGRPRGRAASAGAHLALAPSALLLAAAGGRHQQRLRSRQPAAGKAQTPGRPRLPSSGPTRRARWHSWRRFLTYPRCVVLLRCCGAQAVAGGGGCRVCCCIK